MLVCQRVQYDSKTTRLFMRLPPSSSRGINPCPSPTGGFKEWIRNQWCWDAQYGTLCCLLWVLGWSSIIFNHYSLRFIFVDVGSCLHPNSSDCLTYPGYICFILYYYTYGVCWKQHLCDLIYISNILLCRLPIVWKVPAPKMDVKFITPNVRLWRFIQRGWQGHWRKALFFLSHSDLTIDIEINPS